MTIDPELLHRPDNPNGFGAVLTHGAGANCRSALMLAVAGMLVARGITVLRYDLPFRQKRPTGPPSPATAAADRAGLREAVAAMRTLVSGPVILAGHSYGGRQASMAAAEEPGLVEGLLLLSYPLHPPQQPAKARTAHFPEWQTRAAFVHGERDDFGTLEELGAAIEAIPAEVRIFPVPSAGHDLKKGKFDLNPALDFLL